MNKTSFAKFCEELAEEVAADADVDLDVARGFLRHAIAQRREELVLAATPAPWRDNGGPRVHASTGEIVMGS